jgi:hypothetical protein
VGVRRGVCGIAVGDFYSFGVGIKFDLYKLSMTLLSDRSRIAIVSCLAQRCDGDVIVNAHAKNPSRLPGLLLPVAACEERAIVGLYVAAICDSTTGDT